MTSGSSQGLFVIVAVVIFGIFVLISYVLFRDNLKVSLTSIFEDSITETQNQTASKPKFMKTSNKYVKDLGYGFHVKYTEEEKEKSWDVSGGRTPVLHLTSNIVSEKHKIPWGYSLEVSFDVVSTQDINLAYDYNSYFKLSDGKFEGNDLHTIDYKGSGYSSYFVGVVPKNKKTTLTTKMSNTNISKNSEKQDIYSWSTVIFLVTGNENVKDIDFTITNIQPKIYKTGGVNE